MTTGHEAWFVLDTGATGTTLAADLVARLGLPRSGVTGVETLAGRAAVDTVRVAGLRLAALTALPVDSPKTKSTSYPIHELSSGQKAAMRSISQNIARAPTA